jgi:hypothetical protein
MICAVIIVISAMVLHYAEHEAQSQVFSGFPESQWCAIIGVIAMPTGIVRSTSTVIIHKR